MEWSLSPYTFEDDPFPGEDDDIDHRLDLLAECPDCGDTLTEDEGDPDHGIAAGLHCDTCGWASD